MSDAYETTGGGLRLKGKANKLIQKKRKKKGKCEEIVDLATTSESNKTEEKREKSGSENEDDHKTPAERAFERVQEKRSADRILKKATKSHKQRVEDLNVYLDGLSEHYDIQKVSWTK